MCFCSYFSILQAVHVLIVARFFYFYCKMGLMLAFFDTILKVYTISNIHECDNYVYPICNHTELVMKLSMSS